MTREDLFLKTARLYVYQRIGSNIRERINEAIDVLVSIEGATVSDSNSEITYLEGEALSHRLDRVYQ
jgi:hypothetical protein